MFREVRRNKKQILSQEESVEILEKSTAGVLSLVGDNDYTYGVPLSHVYHQGVLYFHCAKKGHKIDAINKHSKVSFTVIDKDQVVSEEYTTYFRSVIVFGKASLIKDKDEQRKILSLFVDKFSPDFVEGGKEEIEKELVAVQIIRLDIDHISGKEAIELAKARG
ncbi:MAG: 5-nitroimidazole antibiotic resistance protein [Clostridiales bacterium]|nr:5-nitroimidazole antibiotic resistance protein [Clostridiales bacterium]